jgi:hypothetical protein
MAKRPARRKLGKGTWVVAALLVAVLIGWGVARWRAAPALVVPTAPRGVVQQGAHEHVTDDDRAALEKILRERTE